ncbi:MAG TPA: zinc ribbon domain-containing protein [Terriglobales bacterium]|nr:zinc ribbon domain-containing protein [Terriglobales bacterium]
MIDFGIYGAQEPRIFAYRCPQCHTAYYPPPMLCAKCSNRRDPSGIVYDDWEKFPLEGACKLLTWTRVWALPEGYDQPYLLFGMVEFPNGLRASGRLEVESPHLGMELIAWVAESSERPGHPVNIFLFSEAAARPLPTNLRCD